MDDGKLRLGGMALHNGLLVHGPAHWAAAVRRSDGEVRVASGRKPRLALGPGARVPGMRGVLRLAEAIAVIPLVKRALPEAEMPMQDPATLGAVVAATASSRVLRGSGARTVPREAGVALLSLAPALLALRGGDLASYHGVEHKAIAAYEQDAGDARDPAKEHDRCGSHLLAPMLASNVAGTVLLKRVLAGRRSPGARSNPGPLAGGAVALASTAVAVEVFGWCERHAQTGLAKAIRRPGFEIQRVIGTREPDERQLEVGRAALAEILRAEGVQA